MIHALFYIVAFLPPFGVDFRRTRSMTNAASPLLSSPRFVRTSAAQRCSTPSLIAAFRTRRGFLLSTAAALLLACRDSTAAVPPFDPVTERERNVSASLSLRISDAVRLLDLARDLQAKGDYSRALDYFTLVILSASDVHALNLFSPPRLIFFYRYVLLLSP